MGMLRMLTAPNLQNSSHFHLVSLTNQELVEELAESLGDICEELYGTRPKEGSISCFAIFLCWKSPAFQSVPSVV